MYNNVYNNVNSNSNSNSNSNKNSNSNSKSNSNNNNNSSSNNNNNSKSENSGLTNFNYLLNNIPSDSCNDNTPSTNYIAYGVSGLNLSSNAVNNNGGYNYLDSMGNGAALNASFNIEDLSSSQHRTKIYLDPQPTFLFNEPNGYSQNSSVFDSKSDDIPNFLQPTTIVNSTPSVCIFSSDFDENFNQDANNNNQNIRISQQVNNSWNEIFQRLIVQPNSERKLKNLTDLYQTFIETANRYGKIIITERNIPDQDKTIKPIDIGGFAGGVKYKCQNIFFKFAKDKEVFGIHIYGGVSGANHEKAQKSQGLELKAYNRYFEFFFDESGRTPVIHMPLMALIDYCGHRLLAVSEIPIEKSSLVYGSSDGGKNVFNNVKIVNDEMLRFAEHYKIASQTFSAQNSKVELHSAFDVEVHHGKDGRYYIIDLARTFPPLTTIANGDFESDKLFKLMRPELCAKIQNRKISPDVFVASSDQCTDKQKKNVELISSSLNGLIEKKAKILDSIISGLFNQKELSTSDLRSSTKLEQIDSYLWEITHKSHDNVYVMKSDQIDSIINYLHGNGINLRYIGIVCSHIKSIPLKQVLYTEMVARTFKRIIRNEIGKQDHQFSISKKLFSHVIKIIQRRDDTPTTNHFWRSPNKEQFKYCLNVCFESSISEEDYQNDKFDIRSCIDIKLLVYRLIKLFNVRVNTKSMDLFLTTSNYNLKESDIEAFDSILKYPAFIDYTAGMYHLVQAKKLIESRRANRADIHRMLDLAREKLNNALRSLPDDTKTLSNIAYIDLCKSFLTTLSEDSIRLLRQSIVLLRSVSNRTAPILSQLVLANFDLAIQYAHLGQQNRVAHHFADAVKYLKYGLKIYPDEAIRHFMESVLILFNTSNDQHVNPILERWKNYMYILFGMVVHGSVTTKEALSETFNRTFFEIESIRLFKAIDQPVILVKNNKNKNLSGESSISVEVSKGQTLFDMMALVVGNIRKLEVVDSDLSPLFKNDKCVFPKLDSLFYSLNDRSMALNPINQTLSKLLNRRSNLVKFKLVCHLEDIKPTLELSSLTSLYLSMHLNDQVFSPLFDPSKLTSLTLIDHPAMDIYGITSKFSISDSYLSTLLVKCNNLSSLSLSLYFITDVAFKSSLNFLSKLKHFSLSRSARLTPNILTNLVGAIKNTLLSLDLTMTSVTDNTVKTAIKNNPHLESLKVSSDPRNNYCNTDMFLSSQPCSAVSVSQILLETTELSQLKVLHLPAMTSPNNEEHYQYLWQLLGKLPQLTELALPSGIDLMLLVNNIPHSLIPKDWKYAQMEPPMLPKLSKLQLTNVKTTPFAIRKLLLMAPELDSLSIQSSIILRYNGTDTTDLRPLFPLFNQLTELDLSVKGIVDDNKFFRELLTTCTSLYSLKFVTTESSEAWNIPKDFPLVLIQRSVIFEQ